MQIQMKACTVLDSIMNDLADARERDQHRAKMPSAYNVAPDAFAVSVLSEISG